MARLTWSRTIAARVVAIAAGAVVLTAATIAVVVVVKRRSMAQEVEEQLLTLARNEARAVARDVYRLCEVADEELRQKVAGALRVLKVHIAREGGLREDSTRVRWSAVDQLSGARQELELPRLLLGGRWLGQERAAGARVPLVDPVRALVGGTFTVFQRANERGDMLRVATNVIGRDGARAIGTTIPAVGPDGRVNPVVEAVLAGRSYQGRAFVVDGWYLTAYTPVRDGGGRVIGMLYAGIPRDRITSLRRGILSMRLGKTGYVYVLGGEGRERGRYLISQGGKRDGEDIWDAKDSDGQYFIRTIVEKARATSAGEVDFVRYPWLNREAGETSPRYKLAAVTYFAPWDWVIGAGSYEDDFTDAKRRLAASTTSIANWAVGAGLVVALLGALVAVWFSRALSRNLRRVVSAAHELANGEPARVVALELASSDETRELGDALRETAQSVTRALEATGQVTAAAAEGRLDVRADADALPGEFGALLRGVNSGLDAAVGPLRMAAGFVERIARGEIPPPIAEAYRGDFGLRDNLNTLAVTLNGFIGEMREVSRQQDAGETDAALDTARFQGAYGAMAEGVNAMIAGQLRVIDATMGCVAEFGRGNFEAPLPAFPGKRAAINLTVEQVRTNLKALIADAETLVQAAVEGRLTTRADASRHQGDFRRIVEGVNRTLDAVIGPLGVAASYVAQIARGEIPPSIRDEYHGDFNALRNNLNECIAAVERMVQDAGALVQAAVDGELSRRVDVTRHQGEFRRIVGGINELLDAALDPVREASEVLGTLANADLRARIAGSYRGDHARIKESVNTMAEALHQALLQVAEATLQVSSASTQIATSSASVSQGAASQAAALEQTSATLEEISAMTKHNAESTEQARSLAGATRAAADGGNVAMQKMTESMDRIRTAAEETSAIIRDINEIAFQTNLLALNAAVEAARAGDAGRGFAVVAEEVRALALRSKEAARKTEELIHQSVRLAEEGGAVASEVNGSLGEIRASAGKVNQLVEEIAAASTEQARGIQQVTRAIAIMDQSVQQAAASSEETSSAAEELAGQASALTAMVGLFQLARNGTSRHATARLTAGRSAAREHTHAT
jgi:methyl-accepting chemotaxis protein